jgi:BMFP domain-containing protein YqiC
MGEANTQFVVETRERLAVPEFRKEVLEAQFQKVAEMTKSPNQALHDALGNRQKRWGLFS